MGLAFDLVDDVPELVFLEEFLFQELEDRKDQLVKEDPLVFVEVRVEDTHLV
jgi:hypothetical protein